MVKVGIIGAGRIGRVHITSISTRVKDAVIKIVADPFLNDETAEWAKSMGVEHTTKDYKIVMFCNFSHFLFLTKSSKFPASIAKSNKQGTYLYQEGASPF